MWMVLIATALAGGSKGMVVRLESDAALNGAVAATLTPKGGGTPQSIKLLDDGTPPDVSAGDRSWAGSATVSGDAFTVELDAGGRTIDGGEVSWSAKDDLRDVSLKLSGGRLTVKAGTAAGGTAAGGDGSAFASGEVTPGPTGEVRSAAPTAGGQTAATDGASSPTSPGNSVGDGQGSSGSSGTGGAPAAGGVPVGGRATAVTFPSGSSSSDPSLYVGLGLGLLFIVGVAWLWLRSRRDASHEPGSAVSALAEAPLVGNEFPSLSDGLCIWHAQTPEAARALAAPLLTTLARHHRVVFVSPAAITPTRVPGGPVYRAVGMRPSHVGDAIDALEAVGGNPVTVFAWGVAEPAALKDYADELPAGIGGIALVSGEVNVALPTVRCEQDGADWVLSCQSETLRVRVTREGFEPIG